MVICQHTMHWMKSGTTTTIEGAADLSLTRLQVAVRVGRRCLIQDPPRRSVRKPTPVPFARNWA